MEPFEPPGSASVLAATVDPQYFHPGFLRPHLLGFFVDYINVLYNRFYIYI